MRCVYCPAATEVLETRQRKDGTVRRVRQCYFLHKFTTDEQAYVASTGRSPVMGHELRAQGLALDQRVKLIKADLAAGMPLHTVVNRYGCSLRTVQRIKEEIGNL